MQQGTVVTRMRLLLGLYCLRELGHHRAKGILLVEPMGKQMHTHTRQMGRDPDDLCRRGNRRTAFGLTWTAFATIELPLRPPSVDMAQAHRHQYLPFGDLGEEDPARALEVLTEQGPQQGLLNLAELSPSTKGWTCPLIESTLAQGELHDFILLEI
jgi:hypothetical protein